ncbi:MAG: hypothetical protein ACI8XB_001841 [Patiriisocius sp.]|jgi:hypothetical protein
MKDFLKKVYPHLLALFVFAIITSIFFSPMFSGYSINQEDIKKSRGMSQSIKNHRMMYDEDPLWADNMFSGMDAIQISADKSSTPILFIDKLLTLSFPGGIGFFFILFIGFYILLMTLKVDPLIAIIGCVAFAFTSYLIILLIAGHNAKIHAVAFMPAMLAGLILVMRNKKLLGAALFSLFFALQLNANHFQITFYSAFVLLAFGLYYLYQELEGKRGQKLLIGIGAIIVGATISFFVHSWIPMAIAGMLAVGYEAVKSQRFRSFLIRPLIIILAAGVGIMANYVNIVVTKEYSELTQRGASEISINSDGSQMERTEAGLSTDYILSWSYGKAETLNFLIPNLKGGSSFDALLDNKEHRKIVQTSSNRELISLLEAYKKNDPQKMGVRHYWGEQPGTAGPTYIGAIILLLFVLGMVFIKSRLKWAILSVTIMAILLAWGSNLKWLSDIFIEYLPLYNKFRSVTMILVIAQMTFPLLAMLYLKEVLENKEKLAERVNMKRLNISGGIFLATILLVAVLGLNLLSFNSPSELGQLASLDGDNYSFYEKAFEGLADVRKDIFLKDVARSFFLALLAFIFVWLYLKGKVNKMVMIAGLFALVTFDMVGVGKRFVNNEKRGKNYVKWIPDIKLQFPYPAYTSEQVIFDAEKVGITGLDEKIDKMESALKKRHNTKKLSASQQMTAQLGVIGQNTNFRVYELGNSFNSTRTSFYHKSVGGYHAAKFKRYQNIIEFHLAAEQNEAIKGLSAGNFESVKTPVINMLNVKYYLYPQQNPSGAVSDYLALPNPNGNGPVWFINELQRKDSPNDEILSLKDLNTKTTAVINNSQFAGLSNTYSADGNIEMTEYQSNHITYKSNTQVKQYAVFSEIYYKNGWNAFIDGQEVSHNQVNFILRGLEVPAGDHVIEFKYQPVTFINGLKIQAFFSYFIVIMVLVALFFEFKPGTKKQILV